MRPSGLPPKPLLSNEGKTLYRSGDFKQHIDYDREVGLPAIVADEHARLLQTSVYNRDYVELRLIGAAPAKNG